MSSLNFSDGMKFDTSGPLRLTHRKDGWYVIGTGLLMPVDSAQEGREYIAELRARRARHDETK